MKSITRSQSSSPEFQSFKSPSVILSSDDSDIVKTKKVSSSIPASIRRRPLFGRIPKDVPRLRKSAVLKCFGQFVASTPILTRKFELNNDECFISPIAPDENGRIIKSVPKRKSRSLKNAVKAFNAEIKQENKLRSSQKNASAQVNQEINQSKIEEILKIDARTTETLQTSLFKKRSSSLEAESSRTTRASKYVTRQTQTSDSLNALHQKSNQNDPNEERLLSSLKSGVENSLSEVKSSLNQAGEVLKSLDQAKEVINNLDQAKEGFENISTISISDISVFQANDLNQLEENPENESIIFYELATLEDTVEASSIAPQIAPDNNNEPAASSVEKTLVLSHLNLETELKEIKVVKQKVQEEVPISGRSTPFRERLRKRNTSVDQNILPRLNANKRTRKEVEGNKAKKHSPEVRPSVSKIHTKELLSEGNEITESKEELPVQKKGNRKKKTKQKTTAVRRTTALKNSETLETDALPESPPNIESSHDQHTEILKSQLSQLQEFSPCVVLEKLQTHTSNRIQTRNQRKAKLKQDRLPPESSADETNESTVTQSVMDIPDKRDRKKVTVDLYQYVVHRKSGFYQLPDEPITAARVEGRPQRNRRPPKQFIQAAFLPELPKLKRTTKFKPEKIAVKTQVRKGCKKPNVETPSSFRYNLRSSTIISENVSKALSCTTKATESKKEKDNSRIRKPLQDLTENINNRMNSCMDEVEQTASKLTHKKKVGKRLEYGNELRNTDDAVLPEASVRNVNLLFDQSQICISNDTITGVRKFCENESTEENSRFLCLINDKFADVKCYSKMPLFEDTDGHPISVVPNMINQSQNNEFTLGHMKILPNKKLYVEVNKYLFISYTVLKGNGVSTIANRHFPLHEGNIIYVPLGFPYSIQNNGTSPLMLQYTINAKL